MKRKKLKDKIGYIDLFLKEVAEICNNISQKEIDQVVDLFFHAWLNKNNIFFIGNGGSASTASHFAGDINNCTANIENINPIKAISLVDNIVRYSALVNDRGWNNVYVEQIKNFFSHGDIVVAISVHGGSGKDKAEPWSQNLTTALQYAKENGGKTVGLTGFDGGAFNNICDICIIVPFNSTPHVEGFHAIIHHLIYDALAKRIEGTAKKTITSFQ